MIRIKKSITDRFDKSLNSYFKDILNVPLLKPEEETELINEVKKGNKQAFEKLVKSNLRFVVSVAKQYQGKGVPLVDLIQEGNIGLIHSIDTYDPTRGFKFISYAVWWIRQNIIKAISDQCRTVRLPMNHILSVSRINKAINKFEQENLRQPSLSELEERTLYDAERIFTTMSIPNKSISLNTKYDEDFLLEEVIPSDSDQTEDITNNELKNKIQSILSKLSFRDRDVLRMHFGIDMYPMTTKEIAVRYGIGEERVRQIIKDVTKKIRRRYSRELKEFV